MKQPQTGSTWPDDTDVCHIEHLAEVSGLSIDDIADLVEVGLIEPIDSGVQPFYFRLEYILTVKTARRLREDFQLDRHGVALALTLLRRVGELEAELAALKAKRRF